MRSTQTTEDLKQEYSALQNSRKLRVLCLTSVLLLMMLGWGWGFWAVFIMWLVFHQPESQDS